MNDDFPESLTNAFGAVDVGMAPSPDWDDLSQRLARRDRRQRRGLVAGAAVVAVLTGAGGFAIGNNRDSHMTLSANGSPRSASAQTKAAQTKAAQTNTAQATVTPMSGGYPAMQGPIGPMPSTPSEPAVSRTTPGGIVIRSWKQIYPEPTFVDQAQRFLPAACVTAGNLQIAAVTDDDLFNAGAGLSKSTTPEVSVQLSAGLGGKFLALVIVTSTDAKSISVTFPNGTRDSMAPQHGIAVFAIADDGSMQSKWDELDKIKVAATATDGTTSDLSVTGSGGSLVGSYGSASAKDCSPQLPPAGNQPADPAAERAAVTSVFSTIYDSTIGDTDKLGLVDDSTGLAQAYIAARTGQFAEATKNSKFSLKDLVFTSPTEAVVRYDVLIPPNTGSQEVAMNRIGVATFINGTWKATRATVCGDLSLAGASCDAPSGSNVVDPSTMNSGPGPAVPTPTSTPPTSTPPTSTPPGAPR